jgi:hypothetical protein
MAAPVSAGRFPTVRGMSMAQIGVKVEACVKKSASSGVSVLANHNDVILIGAHFALFSGSAARALS